MPSDFTSSRHLGKIMPNAYSSSTTVPVGARPHGRSGNIAVGLRSRCHHPAGAAVSTRNAALPRVLGAPAMRTTGDSVGGGRYLGCGAAACRLLRQRLVFRPAVAR